MTLTDEKRSNMLDAALNHEENGRLSIAALVYEKAEDYVNAKRCYEEKKMYLSAAEMAEKLDDPWEAERLHDLEGTMHGLRGLFLDRFEGKPLRNLYDPFVEGDLERAARNWES
ncbi:hypothetical protein HYT58_00630 [Candidatus Woesearchaeota archaeon]|nr:hypothetical protein [Candidatus Woesearchaeota archaeon]